MTKHRPQSWFSYLNRPVDAASLAVFRIVFGAMVAWDAQRYLANGWVDEYFVGTKINFTYLYLDFVQPLPPPWIYGHFYFIGAMGLLVSLGLFYRIAIVGLWLSYSYFFLLEQSTYMNHYYLIALVAFLLSLMPAHRAYSLDRRRGAVVERTVPHWCVLLIRLQLCIVYFYGAIAKLNADWLSGEPMYTLILQNGSDIPEIASLVPPALLAYVIAYSGLLVDATIPILLVYRPTRWLGLALAFSFHALNAIFLNIGIFSYLMIGAITIFLDADWPGQLARRLGATSRAPTVVSQEGHTGWPLLTLVHLYVAFQLLFPFRHMLFPGNVSWTEEGHRFAWHMKLRKKDSNITIIAKDPATGKQWAIDPTQDLRNRQLRKLATFPDIMVQYAHFKAEELKRQGIDDAEIRVEWMCSLNGAPAALLIDPNLDLTKIERDWRHAEWILPQPKRN